MAMMHIRVVTNRQDVEGVRAVFHEEVGAVAVTLTESSDGVVVTGDVARESVDDLLHHFRVMGVLERGVVTLAPLDTSLGRLADLAEAAAPGEGADALIWDDVTARTGEDSALTWTFASFMVLATLLAAIGVVTDSQITIVGAMVVGPEFGPLAAIAVGLVRRRGSIARRAAVALTAGFALAIALTSLLALVGRSAGLFDAGDVRAGHTTEFIYHPGWFSLITALVAGAAGMLSLTSSKSAALVGVFISVTTIPAAGNAAVAATVGAWRQSTQSLLQLAINIVGIVLAAALTLLLLERAQKPRFRRGSKRSDDAAHT